MPNYEDGTCPFEVPDIEENSYLQSKIFKTKMLSHQ